MPIHKIADRTSDGRLLISWNLRALFTLPRYLRIWWPLSPIFRAASGISLGVYSAGESANDDCVIVIFCDSVRKQNTPTANRGVFRLSIWADRNGNTILISILSAQSIKINRFVRAIS